MEPARWTGRAVRVGWQLGRVGQRRNYPLVVLLLLLTLMDALAAGDFERLRRAVWAALWLIGTVVAIVGGRAIPLFTASRLQLPASWIIVMGWVPPVTPAHRVPRCARTARAISARPVSGGDDLAL